MSVVTQHHAPAPARARVIEADGNWCPMAHCNRLDDSFQDIQPLRAIRERIKITDPIVSPRGFIHLGAFTGRRMAVCAYAGRHRPALVAFDYQRGDVIWTSGPSDLVGHPERIPAGILIGRMAVGDKPPRTHVFGANPSEFAAWTAAGALLWKRSCREISPDAPEGVGSPLSISFTRAGELFAATTFGWVILLDPLDGSVLDAYRMVTKVAVDGKLCHGVFANHKSPVIIGDAAYLLVEFRPAAGEALLPVRAPVHLLRIELRPGAGPRGVTRIVPIQSIRNPSDQCTDRVRIGYFHGRGSPPAMVTRRGTVMIFATASVPQPSGLLPVIAGIEDDGRELRLRWRSVMAAIPGDRVHSAPGLHGPSGTLLVSTRYSIFRYDAVDRLSGEVPSPPALEAESMIPRAAQPGVTRVAYGSPFALALDPRKGDLVVCTNFILAGRRRVVFGFLGAFALRPGERSAPTPLWSEPLATTDVGLPAPGLGTFGQPALFQDGDGRTGLIVNTANTGTFIFR
jgi:hypothetical protein